MLSRAHLFLAEFWVLWRYRKIKLFKNYIQNRHPHTPTLTHTHPPLTHIHPHTHTYAYICQIIRGKALSMFIKFQMSRSSKFMFGRSVELILAKIGSYVSLIRSSTCKSFTILKYVLNSLYFVYVNNKLQKIIITILPSKVSQIWLFIIDCCSYILTW